MTHPRFRFPPARRLLAALVLGLALLPPGAAAAEERIRIRPGSPDTLVRIEALFPRRSGACEAKQRRPIRAVYRGTVEISRETDGTLTVINTLPFGQYLEGLAEMPASWPAAALEAQAIAARTYALEQTGRRGGAGRYDICSTDRCQVYRGAAAALGAFGERWTDAVAKTAGRAVTWRGRPIEAFYFSTSTGRTRSNADVFGGTARPYLRSVTAHDEASPLARWRVRIPLGHLTSVLRAGRRWRGGAIVGVRAAGGGVRVSDGNATVRLSRAALRSALNSEAPCLYPGRYPTKGSQAGTRLPLTVPSSSYTVRLRGGEAELRGRGWGHDVGMSQYGARALAERERSAERILGHFYRGTRVEEVSEPRAIRVLAVSDANEVRVSIDGEFSASGDAATRGSRFEVVGGRALRVRRGGPSLPPLTEIETRLRPATLAPGATLTVPFGLSRPARVRAIVRSGDEIVAEREESFESGDGEISLPLTTAAPGGYEATLEAFDGIDRVRTDPVAITIAAPRDRAAARAPERPGDGLPAWLVAALAAVPLAGAAAFVARRLRRRSR